MSEPNVHAIHRRWDWQYPMMARAEGIYLYDTTGKRYIDGSGGSSVVTSIGHGVREIPQAMAKAAEDFSFYPAHLFTNRYYLELGELIAGIAPGEMKDNCKTWATNSGSEANDDAVRLARQYWLLKKRGTKHIFIGRWQAFHGNHLAVAGYSGITARRRQFVPMFPASPHIPPAFCYRCPFEKSLPECGLLCARALDREICQIGPENVAAFIAEPVVGAALGCAPAPPGYFQLIREICDKHDVLFIADEVMAGLGRTGRMWSIEHWGVTPDIITSAKGITGGYAPLAAVIARSEIWDVLQEANSPYAAGHTLNANAISCVAGIATIRYIMEHGLVENSRDVGAYLHDRMRERLLESPIIGDVRGMGMMVGFEIVRDRSTKEPFPVAAKASGRLSTITFRNGLAIYPGTGTVNGIDGNQVLLAPPLILTREQADEMVDILEESIKELEREIT